MLAARDITGLVLAGGRGQRMGGADKGLLPFHGSTLAGHALRRLQPQVGAVALNANRHLDAYHRLGVPVWPDDVDGFAGPLAGLLVGLERAATPWLLSVPCDTPRFPPDLARRLADGLARQPGAQIAMALAPDGEGRLRRQPVFCLLHTGLRGSLRQFLASGGRRVGEWLEPFGPALVSFDTAADDPAAFANANTPDELDALRARPG